MMKVKRPFSPPETRLTRAIRWLTIGVVLYGLVWIALEGAVPQVLLLGGGMTAILLGRLLTWIINGRSLNDWQWAGVLTLLGLLFGVGLVVITFFLMGVKTGLHAHGPEFTPQEIVWLWQQLPLWTVVGGLVGLGIGLLSGQQPFSESVKQNEQSGRTQREL